MIGRLGSHLNHSVTIVDNCSMTSDELAVLCAARMYPIPRREALIAPKAVARSPPDQFLRRAQVAVDHVHRPAVPPSRGRAGRATVTSTSGGSVASSSAMSGNVARNTWLEATTRTRAWEPECSITDLPPGDLLARRMAALLPREIVANGSV